MSARCGFGKSSARMVSNGELLSLSASAQRAHSIERNSTTESIQFLLRITAFPVDWRSAVSGHSFGCSGSASRHDAYSMPTDQSLRAPVRCKRGHRTATVVPHGLHRQPLRSRSTAKRPQAAMATVRTCVVAQCNCHAPSVVPLPSVRVGASAIFRGSSGPCRHAVVRRLPAR